MVRITIRSPMRRHLRVWAICLLCGALSVSVACAQTREETLDFLLRDVVINDEYFDSSVPVSYYDKRHSSNFTITEKDCVVTVSAYISGAFWNPGSGDEYYDNQPMSVTIDFSKLIFNDGTSQDISGADADDGLRGGLKISIPGDEGAVTGWTLEWGRKKAQTTTLVPKVSHLTISSCEGTTRIKCHQIFLFRLLQG
jgi:hypothetical protein